MNNTIISQNRFTEIVDSFSGIDPIFILGDIGIDKYTYGDVERISPEAPVPVVEVKKEWTQLGLAANILNNLQDLQISASMCGVIGQDPHGKSFIEMLQVKGLETDLIVSMATRPTTYKERITTATQQICRVDYESKSYLTAEEEDALFNKIQKKSGSYRALIIEDYAKGVLTESLAQRSIKIFKEQGKLVTIDPARNIPPLFYKGATLLKPNLVEAISMVKFFGYKESDPVKMAEILCDKLDLEKIIITLGSEGMAIFDTIEKSLDGVHFIPTVAREVFDVSGAGDTVISVLTASLLTGATLMEAAWIGNCAAGVVVAKKGTATVTPQELLAFYPKMAAQIQ